VNTLDVAMRADDAAVAGFFEDLPVLLIILAGVSVLVLSGVVASERLAEAEREIELDQTASRFVASIMTSLVRDPSMDHTSVALLVSLNISRCACDALDGESWSASLVLLGTFAEWLRTESSAGTQPLADTGYSACLLNAVMDDGLIGVVEVTVLVWR
jgi:hypothetical protein